MAIGARGGIKMFSRRACSPCCGSRRASSPAKHRKKNMSASIHHSSETASNTDRDTAAKFEPKSLRTFTPSQAVLAKSAGVYHWTPEGRRLFDFSSGVLVANLGHNPSSWMKKFTSYMGWTSAPWDHAS